MKIWIRPLPGAQWQAIPNPLSTNHVVWALCTRAQRHPWVVKNRVHTIGAVCGEGLHIGTGGGEVNSLTSRDSRGFLRLWRHAAVVPTKTSARGYAM